MSEYKKTWKLSTNLRLGQETAWMKAAEIIDNPQAHIDALVAAGVLEQVHIGEGDYRGNVVHEVYGYLVVQPPPHVHEWRTTTAHCACGRHIEAYMTGFPVEAPND